MQFITASRVLYGMARRGWLPPSLGSVNRDTHTPLLATLLITGAILLFALWRLKARQPKKGGLTIPYWVPVTGVFVNLAFITYPLVCWQWSGG